jgi:hypothetical protein
MSRFSVAVVVIGLGASSIVMSGCAGELTEEQKVPRDRDGGGNIGGSGGAGGSVGGSGGATGGSGGATGGSGGATGGSGGTTGGSTEACVLTLIKDPNPSKACATLGCHSGSSPAAGFLFTEAVVRQPKDELVDKPNKGYGGVMPGCLANVGKLIDRAQPEKSILYTKVTAQPPCGNRMPVGIVLADAEVACILNWIKSVASAP